LFWVHKYADLLKLYELDKVSLDDLWDEDWAIIQNILFEKQAYKIQKSEEAERVQRLLGENKKGFNSKF
jgi:hypothetical protein